MRRRRSSARLLVALVGAALCTVLASCSASNGSAASSPSGGAALGAPAAGVGIPAAGANQSVVQGKGQAGAQAPLGGSGRQVIRTATIALNVGDVLSTAARVRQIGVAAGGYASSEDTETNHASITLQVPQNSFDSVLDQLAGLGPVQSRGQQAEDVTNQLVDMQSRIATAQASVARVRALMDKATSIADITSIESELTTRETNLETLERQQDELAGQVALSTVTVTLNRTVSAAPAPAATAPPGFLGGLAGGWHAFVATARVVLAVFGAVLPFLVGLGLPVLAVLLVLRQRASRRKPRLPIEEAASD